MSSPLLQSYSRKPYLRFPGQPYTASTRFSDEWGRCLHDNIIRGQNLLDKFGQIPSVAEWRKIFSYEISDELSDVDNITWEDTGNTISATQMKHLHQMAVDLASSHPIGLFEDSWIGADNTPPLTPDGTAWSAAVSCLGHLWVPESASAFIETPAPRPAPMTPLPIGIRFDPYLRDDDNEESDRIRSWSAPTRLPFPQLENMTRFDSYLRDDHNKENERMRSWSMATRRPIPPPANTIRFDSYLRDDNKDNERMLNCLSCSDLALKELTLEIPRASLLKYQGARLQQAILRAFEAIATNTSLAILNIKANDDSVLGETRNLFRDALKKALSLNKSLNDIRITTCRDTIYIVLDIALSCPRLEALTVQTRIPFGVEITAFAQLLSVDTKLRSLTIGGFYMDSQRGALLAAAFHGNRTIQTLTMLEGAFSHGAGVSFAEALPQDHSLKAISFDLYSIDEDSVVRIVCALCATPLKALSLVGSRRFKLNKDGCERIIQVLKENEHSFTKLDLFWTSQDFPWQNEIQLQIDMLTWENCLQVEKSTWADRVIEQAVRTQDLVCFALERANWVDNDRFSDAPNMLYYLIKESPDFFKDLHQMAVNLESSHPIVLFEDSWIEADNIPPVTPDGTAWEAAVSCLGNLWAPESTSAPVAAPTPITPPMTPPPRMPSPLFTVPPLAAHEQVYDIHHYNNPFMMTSTTAMEPLWECDTIGCFYDDEENEQALDRLRRNDPVLKEMTLEMPYYSRRGTERCFQMILQAFDAIATSSSLEILDINIYCMCAGFLYHHAKEVTDRATRALSLNTSLKHIRIATYQRLKNTLNLVMASPNLQALTVRCDFTPSIADLTDMAQVLSINTNLHSLTVERFIMDSDLGIAFAAVFHGNEAIKTLTIRRNAINTDGGVSFAEALSHDHSLEKINFEDNGLNDDGAVSIVRTLCRKHLKNLSLVDNKISRDGYERIVQILRDNEHTFIKLDLFQDSEDPPWHNFIRCEIDKLTWKNCLQVEKETWVDTFLQQEAPSQELLFRALERAKKVDKERFAPNMLFYLIKESPDLIVQAIRNGL